VALFYGSRCTFENVLNT